MLFKCYSRCPEIKEFCIERGDDIYQDCYIKSELILILSQNSLSPRFQYFFHNIHCTIKCKAHDVNTDC